MLFYFSEYITISGNPSHKFTVLLVTDRYKVSIMDERDLPRIMFNAFIHNLNEIQLCLYIKILESEIKLCFILINWSINLLINQSALFLLKKFFHSYNEFLYIFYLFYIKRLREYV